MRRGSHGKFRGRSGVQAVRFESKLSEQTRMHVCEEVESEGGECFFGFLSAGKNSRSETRKAGSSMFTETSSLVLAGPAELALALLLLGSVVLPLGTGGTGNEQIPEGLAWPPGFGS